MRFWRLLVLAACASLLGSAAARLIGPRLPEILSTPSRPAGADEPVAPPSGQDGGAAPDGGSEGLPAATPPDPPPAASPRRTARTARHRGDQLADALARGIRKLGERRYQIERGSFELALRNLGSLSGLVRVVPEIRDGKPSGFRLVAVKTGGPFAKLGLRRDDVLVSVNGLDIRTPDRALEAHGKLRSASRFALGVMRDGRQVVQEYTIR
jgi:hypothetical protein